MSIVRSVSGVLAAVALAAVPVMVSASDQVVKPKDSAATQSAPAKQFTALKGVKAAPMSSSELKAIKGQHVHFIEPGNGFDKIHLAGNPENNGIGIGNWYDNGSPDGGLVAPSYHGLCKAGPIGIPVMPGQLSQCP
jgi:hypothetical protein